MLRLARHRAGVTTDAVVLVDDESVPQCPLLRYAPCREPEPNSLATRDPRLVISTLLNDEVELAFLLELLFEGVSQIFRPGRDVR